MGKRGKIGCTDEILKFLPSNKEAVDVDVVLFSDSCCKNMLCVD